VSRVTIDAWLRADKIRKQNAGGAVVVPLADILAASVGGKRWKIRSP
jgi:hypothetical protein